MKKGLFTPLETFRVTTVKDSFTKFYRCVAEIKMKIRVEDGFAPSKGAISRGVGQGEGLSLVAL